MARLWFYGAVAGEAHGAQILAKRKRSFAPVEQKARMLPVSRWGNAPAVLVNSPVLEGAEWRCLDRP